jgi:hypothetical protein
MITVTTTSGIESTLFGVNFSFALGSELVARVDGYPDGRDGRMEGRKEGRKKERKEREGVRQNIKNPLPISLTPSREAEASDPCTMPNAFYSACCNNALLRRESS